MQPQNVNPNDPPAPDDSRASPVVERDAGRVIVLDPAGRVLLLQCGEPGNPRRWWITPGGGCEPGESHAQAALREAEEELGFDDLTLGPCVWTRTHTFPWLGRTLRQHEHFFLCHTHAREPVTDGHTDDELLYLHGHRWWSPADIVAATAAGESFAPQALGELVETLQSQPLPAEPADVSV